MYKKLTYKIMNINLVKFLIKLKNASLNKKNTFFIQYNKIILELLNLLYNEGLIQSFKLNKNKTIIYIFIRYYYNKNILKDLKIVSKGSKITYLRYLDICRFFNKHSILVFSTNKGFLTNLDCKRYKIGGKLLFIF